MSTEGDTPAHHCWRQQPAGRYTRFMRLSGVLILVVVLSMAVVVFLQSRDVTVKSQALASISSDLREEGVDGVRFDRERAFEIIRQLEALTATPEFVDGHTDDLKTIAETAASWASDAPSPSPELHASVAIRKAAVELRSYGVQPEKSALRRARYELEKARDALTVSGGGDAPAAPSGLATEGVRDRLQNLEAAQKERHLAVEEELNQ